MSYKRILVAVDGSKTAENALVEAIHMTKALDGVLCVMYVADEYPISLPLGINLKHYQDAVRQEGQTILEKMKILAQDNHASPEIQLIEITDGKIKISEKIIEAAKEWRADLLIIGTHGRRGVHRFLLGSVAEEVVRISTLPVLLVRGEK
jgi:nucleotide-binding universal stress UspA family protein